VAAGLLVAAILKSSQFPLTSLFARSMEGPTPASPRLCRPLRARRHGTACRHNAPVVRL
jgi:hypothetical protein